jgi:hypothetical protein
MYSNSAAGAINMRAHTTKVSTSFISCKKYTDFRTANNAYYYMLQIDFLFSSISCLNYMVGHWALLQHSFWLPDIDGLDKTEMHVQ